MQHVKRLRHIFSSVACLGLPYFPHYLKQHHFRKKKTVIEHEMSVLIFPTNFFWNISHSEKN